jgi:hypothetical protein
VNATMIYCENFFKCYNVPPVQQQYKKREKNPVFPENFKK